MKQNKPSATAMFVANGMYHNIGCETLGADIPADLKKFCSELVEYHYGSGRLKKRLLRARTSLLQIFSIPGFYLHFLVRKKCIESQVINFLNSGFEQVIVLGAGYDTLCSRLAPAFPGVNFIELDHPATAGYKMHLFKALGWKRSNIGYIAQDLLSSDNFFRDHGVDTSLKTVFVCEGVFMYLRANNVDHILSSVRSNFTGACGFVFTFMEEHGNRNYMFKNAGSFVKLWLRIKNEPFTWGLKPEAMAEFLSRRGWQLSALFDAEKLKMQFLSPQNRHLPVAIGEDVAVCLKS